MIRDKFNFGVKQGFESLIQILDKRKVVLYAGSGLSKQYNTQFPDWKTFIRKMIKEISRNIDSDTRTSIRGLITKGKLLDAAELSRRRMSPNNYIKFMQETFEKPLFLRGKLRSHKILSELPFAAIVTTNYDQLLERSFEKSNKEIPVYTQNDSPSLGTLLQPLRNPDAQKPVFLLKAHGDLTKPETWVLTSDDYRKIIMRNPAYRLLMRTLLTQFSMLFVGFSLSDPDFQLLLQDVMDAFEGEMPDHFMLTPNLSCVEQEVLYRTYRVRVIPYGDWNKMPQILTEINDVLLKGRQNLSNSPNLEEIKSYVINNSNFEDPIHRKETLGKHLKIIRRVVDETLGNPDLDIDGFKNLLEIERILTHHVYLFPELKVREDIAPKLLDKAKELYEKKVIRNLKRDLGEFAWMLYMVAIEDIGFPLVRYPKREGSNGKLMDKSIQKLHVKILDEKITLINNLFNLIPRNKSEGEELKAACFNNRINGLKLINLYEDSKGYELLDIALNLAQKANWESIEAALLQDIVRPEPNPWADEQRVRVIRNRYKDLSTAIFRMKESIELARYKGMHRRVIGGLIGLSLLVDGDERIKQLKYATDYYLLHQVDQEPLEAVLYAEETITLDEIGHLTNFERKRRSTWLQYKQKKSSQPRINLLHPLYKGKLSKILRPSD
jgi:hypothetical protein